MRAKFIKPLIAEIGINHNGQLKEAFKLIDWQKSMILMQ